MWLFHCILWNRAVKKNSQGTERGIRRVHVTYSLSICHIPDSVISTTLYILHDIVRQRTFTTQSALINPHTYHPQMTRETPHPLGTPNPGDSGQKIIHEQSQPLPYTSVEGSRDCWANRHGNVPLFSHPAPTTTAIGGSTSTNVHSADDPFDATGRLSYRSLTAATVDPPPPNLQTFCPPGVIGSATDTRRFEVDKVAVPLPAFDVTPHHSTHSPGDMAMFLNHQNNPPSPYPSMHANRALLPPEPGGDDDARATRMREKKHACWMCHKSFDRPSTLRKVRLIIQVSWRRLTFVSQHLLVHTGEKGPLVLAFSSQQVVLTKSGQLSCVTHADAASA
jgi:hypothetical protein